MGGGGGGGGWVKSLFKRRRFELVLSLFGCRENIGI